MVPGRVEKVVIVGGGTAGWMAAAALKNTAGGSLDVHLVESEEIGTVGVGESSLPQLRGFNRAIGIQEADFIRESKATFKLGIEFVDWGWIGNRFFHVFGDFGAPVDRIPAYQYWLKLRAMGEDLALLEQCAPAVMAKRNRFVPPQPDPRSPFWSYFYAYQFDAGLYAAFLRKFSERLGVKRTNARIVDAKLNGEDGFIQALVLQDGREIEGDLFIDCSGFIGLLIEKVLKSGYEDWTHWLPCDRALAIACESVSPLTPFTRSIAHDAGWQWRIPLQHRVGNGYVYCSRFVSDEGAADTLLSNLDGKPTGTPRQLRFVTGRRKKFWNKNCVAMGLAAGFLEPLESTSILLIQSAVERLIAYFPEKNFQPSLEAEFNRLSVVEYERLRDFIILHYALTKRTDSELWKYCREMQVPDTLQYKMDLFRARGVPVVLEGDGFKESSWIALCNGHGVIPETYNSLVEQKHPEEIRELLQERSAVLRDAVEKMPTHEEFLLRHFDIAVAA